MGLLELIIIILLIMWIAGLGFGVAGNLVHLLLLIAVIVLVVRLLRGNTVV